MKRSWALLAFSAGLIATSARGQVSGPGSPISKAPQTAAVAVAAPSSGSAVARIQAALNACAGGRCAVQLAPGTYTVDGVGLNLPSGTDLRAQRGGVKIVSTISGADTNVCHSVFNACATVGGTTTTLAGAFDPATASPPTQVTLTSASTAGITAAALAAATAAGQPFSVIIQDGFHAFVGPVTAVSGNVVTFQIPIDRAFPSTATATTIVVPQDIYVDLGGGVVSGTGPQGWESQGYNIHLAYARIAGAFVREVAVLDTGSRWSSMDFVDIDGGGVTSNCFSSESGAQSSFNNCRAANCTSVGYWGPDGVDVTWRDDISVGNPTGVLLTDQGNALAASTAGCQRCKILGGSYLWGTYGVFISAYSQDTKVIGVDASYNSTAGIYLAGATGGTPPARNSISQVTARYCGTGVDIDAADTQIGLLDVSGSKNYGLKLESGSARTIAAGPINARGVGTGGFASAALYVTAGSIGNRVSTIDTSGVIGSSPSALYVAGSVSVDRWTHASTVFDLGAQIAATGLLQLSGFDVDTTVGGSYVVYSNSNGGAQRFRGGTMTGAASAGQGLIQLGSSTWDLADVRTIGAIGIGLNFAGSGRVTIANTCDFSSATTPETGGTYTAPTASAGNVH